jgi:hypothetical protein
MFHLLFQRLNKLYENIFTSYGSFLAKYYVYTITFAFVLNLGLSLGIMRLRVITEVDELFMPVSSEARRAEARVKYLFNESATLAHDFYIHQLPDLGTWAEVNFQPCGNDNILQLKYIQEIKRINEHILNQTVIMNAKNETISFEQVCARRFGECVVDGLDILEEQFYHTWLKMAVMQRIRSREEEKSSETQPEEGSPDTEQQTRFYMKLKGGKTSLNDLSFILGRQFRIFSSLNESSSSIPAFASVIKIRYNLNSPNQRPKANVVLWEAKFVEVMKKLVQNTVDLKRQCHEPVRSESALLKNLKVSFAGSQSMELEMEANMNIDTILIVGTFVLIIMFSILLMSINSNCITSPGVLLPMSGILSAVFGMTSSFGLMALLNYPGCKLILVIPVSTSFVIAISDYQ